MPEMNRRFAEDGRETNTEEGSMWKILSTRMRRVDQERIRCEVAVRKNFQ